MNRRSFLGWLGGGIAVYAADLHPVGGFVKTAHMPACLSPSHSEAQTYVLRNECDQPMVVNYRRTEIRRGPDIPQDILTSRGRANKERHLSAILLPGEELTIAAVPFRG